ncbi:hypothetical protein OG402_38260 [Streptomyces anulatus]|uniref:hypothetical protein n=1 Tax=Streptomyces anulatus TaxID=1892 RepID=UPI002250CBFB|nr:hypothetical protein [Streptomyces anulatus]MCX4523284.1 hypothetical protein [Streptomyces anulatus]MCX4606295.1 hypothetical protein [Streptomyces anulatus]WSU78221.1 hypothetical protein OG499_37080 [Streptomyces anulatus]
MTDPQHPGVSPKAEKALLDAMERLLNGKPARTDGKLTKNNLWREAGVSRATMNRATRVLETWDARVSSSPASLHSQQQAEEIARLRKKLRLNQDERQRLQDQVDAVTTVLTVLLAENAALREQLANRSAVVIPLGRTQARP